VDEFGCVCDALKELVGFGKTGLASMIIKRCEGFDYRRLLQRTMMWSSLVGAWWEQQLAVALVRLEPVIGLCLIYTWEYIRILTHCIRCANHTSLAILLYVP
jgi:hypothetical protein